MSGPDIPGKSLKAAVKGGARADWGKRNANAELAAEARRVEHPGEARGGELGAARGQLRRRRRPAERRPVLSAGEAGAPAPAGGAGGPGGGAAGAEKPIDLAALKTLNATGNVKVGALQVQNIKADNVAAGIKAAGGRLDVESDVGESLPGHARRERRR